MTAIEHATSSLNEELKFMYFLFYAHIYFLHFMRIEIRITA